jgi:hypothetical protein
VLPKEEAAIMTMLQSTSQAGSVPPVLHHHCTTKLTCKTKTRHRIHSTNYSAAQEIGVSAAAILKGVQGKKNRIKFNSENLCAS